MHKAGVLAVTFLTLAPGVSAQTPDRYSIPGNVVAVYNLAGAVSIERGTGSNVVIEVTRGGRDADRLRIERTEVNGNQALVIRYPDDDVVYERGGGSSQINVRDDGTFFGRGARGSRVTIRRSGRGTQAHADLRILVPERHDLELRLGVGEVVARDVAGGLDIDVATAAVRTGNTQGRLRIDTGSGSVSIEGAEGDEVIVDTGSGSVEVNGIRAGRLIIDTGSGRVRGSRVAASELGVDTGSGSVTLDGVSARDISVDTGSGSVTVDIASQIERLIVDTGSGSVRLTVPADLSAAVEIETGSGGIDIDLPVHATRRSRGHFVGSVGSGRSAARIEIDTGSGGVSIRPR